MTPESLTNSISDTPYSLELNATTLPQINLLIQDANDLKIRYKAAHENIGVLLRTDPEFRAFQTYHSNKLELQGPDLEETKLIIDEFVKQEQPKDLRMFAAIQAVTTDSHLLDVLGQHQANILVERISEAFSKDSALRQHDIRQLNWFCIQHKFFAGEYRTHDLVNIDQFFDDHDDLWFSRPATHPVEVAWIDIPVEMRKICEYVSEDQECPILAASVAHAWFTRVHPFLDGNGRTARLIANLVLIRNGWPPLTVTKQHRDEYIDALRESDKGGDIRLLFHLFVKCMQQGLSEIESPEFWKRRYRIEAQKNEIKRHSDWTDLTRRFTNTLRNYVGNNGWTLERVSMPDKTTFQLLEDRDPTASVPLGLLRHPDKREIKIHIGYMSNELRQAQDFDTTIDDLHYPPTLYMREKNYLPAAEYPFVHRGSSQIPTREFTFIPGSLEEIQTKVLIGKARPTPLEKSKARPTPLEMSIEKLCERLASEIEKLQFAGFQPHPYLDDISQQFIDSVSQLIESGEIKGWDEIYKYALTRISEGYLLHNDLMKVGIYMSKIGQIFDSIQKVYPDLGMQRIPIAEKLFTILKANRFRLVLIESSQPQMPPILSEKRGYKGELWAPKKN